MSLEYRIQRIDNIVKSWGLNREHDLIASLPLDLKLYNDFKLKIKLYVSKALNFAYESDDDSFPLSLSSCSSTLIEKVIDSGITTISRN